MNYEILVLSLFVAFGLVFFLFLRKYLRWRKNYKQIEQVVLISRVQTALKKLKIARLKISSSTYYEFSCLLSNALKYYLHSAYKIRAIRATSDEIVKLLMSDAKNDWRIISLLSEVFRITDSVKFSRRKLAIPQQRGIYKSACRFILLSERVKNRKLS